MKREYVKPTMEMEQFVANQYVAACRVCEANAGIFFDTNGNGVWDRIGDSNITHRKHTTTGALANVTASGAVIVDGSDISGNTAFRRMGSNSNIQNGYFFTDTKGGYHYTSDASALTNASN